MHRSRSLVLALAAGVGLLLVLARTSAVPTPAAAEPEAVAAAPLRESASSSSAAAPDETQPAAESGAPAASERAVVPESERATLHVEVRGAPHCEDEWLRVTVFDLTSVAEPRVDADDISRQLELHELAAKRVFAEELATPEAQAEAACAVPVERELVAVAHRDVVGFLPSNAVMPLVSERIRLTAGAEERVVLDYGTKLRIAGRLVGAANLAKEVTVSEASAKGLRTLFQVRADPEPDGTFTIVGAAPGSYAFRAEGGEFPEHAARLVDATTGERRLEIEGDAFLALRLADPYGAIRMTRDGAVAPVSFHWGLNSSTATHAADQRVSLPMLRRVGASDAFRLWFRTRAEGLFSRELGQLHHEENGDVLVELPDQRGASIEIVAPGVTKPETWRVLACAESGEFGGIPAEWRDGRWVFDGIPAGTYDFFWSHAVPFRHNAAIARGMRVEAGDTYRLESELPEFVPTRIAIRNWDELPELLRPSNVWIGEVNARPTKTRGVFEAELARPLDRYPVARYLSPHLGGLVTAELTVIEDGIVLECPLVEPAVVRPRPVFGGAITLQCFTALRWISSGTMRLPTRVKPQADGSFLVHCGDEDATVCAVHERDPETKANVFRGFVRIRRDDRDLAPELRGRWVAIERAGSGMVTVKLRAGHDGADFFMLHATTERSSRFWLPDSVESIRVDDDGEIVTLATSSIGATLRL